MVGERDDATIVTRLRKNDDAANVLLAFVRCAVARETILLFPLHCASVVVR